MKINVPESVVEHFWEEESPGTTHEFWAFRFPVRAEVGDTIHFYINKEKVAQATVDLIEPPGQSSCSTTGRFENRWKVFWKCESFKDIR